MELKIVLAERLNNLLKKKGWSTYKLSRKTGLTPYTLQGILACRYDDIKLKTLILISHAFDMSVSEFLNDEKFLYNNLKIDK